MADWQPIETAPKDGTEILLFGPFEARPDRPFYAVAWFYPAGGEWVIADRAAPWVMERFTHWSPLTQPHTDGVQNTDGGQHG